MIFTVCRLFGTIDQLSPAVVRSAGPFGATAGYAHKPEPIGSVTV